MLSRHQRKTQTGYVDNTKHKLLTTPPRHWKTENHASGWLVSTGIYLSQQRVVGIKESWFACLLRWNVFAVHGRTQPPIQWVPGGLSLRWRVRGVTYTTSIYCQGWWVELYVPFLLGSFSVHWDNFTFAPPHYSCWWKSSASVGEFRISTYGIWYDIWHFINCNWVVTRWQ